MGKKKLSDAEVDKKIREAVAQDKANTTGKIKGGLDRIKKATGQKK
jgi:hypothetical protein